MDIVIWLNSIGLIFGVIGAVGLAFFTKVFIITNPDGTQSWGPPDGVDNETWLANNRKIRKTQKYIIPASYVFLAAGFLSQLAGLWLPKVL